MGDRSVTFFHDERGGQRSPAIYTHWNGSETADWIKEAGPLLRRGDPLYAAARFCGFCHSKIDGVTGLGLLSEPANIDPEYLGSIDGYSHGDAGVFAVNVDTGEVVNYRSGEARDRFTIDLAAA